LDSKPFRSFSRISAGAAAGDGDDDDDDADDDDVPQTWEFGMMMGGELHYMEMFLRNAFALPTQPVVMILDPGEPSREEDRSVDCMP
jgi:hypothetical protein